MALLRIDSDPSDPEAVVYLAYANQINMRTWLLPLVDSDSEILDTEGGSSTQSLEHVTGTDGKTWEQIYDFNTSDNVIEIDDASEFSFSYSILVRDNTSGGLTKVSYVDISQMNAYSASSVDGTWLADWLQDNHPHRQHSDFVDDSHNNNDTQGETTYPITYIRADGTKGRNKMSGVIGDSGGSLSISPSSRDLVMQDGVGTDRSVVDYSEGNLGDLAGKASVAWFDRTINNTIGVAVASWDGGDNYVANSFELQDGMVLSSLNTTDTSGGDGPDAFHASVQLSGGIDLAGAINTNNGYRVNQDIGQTIVNWVTKGILTNPSVVETRAANLGPNDKILCIKA